MTAPATVVQVHGARDFCPERFVELEERHLALHTPRVLVDFFDAGVGRVVLVQMSPTSCSTRSSSVIMPTAVPNSSTTMAICKRLVFNSCNSVACQHAFPARSALFARRRTA